MLGVPSLPVWVMVLSSSLPLTVGVFERGGVLVWDCVTAARTCVRVSAVLLRSSSFDRMRRISLSVFCCAAWRCLMALISLPWSDSCCCCVLTDSVIALSVPLIWSTSARCASCSALDWAVRERSSSCSSLRETPDSLLEVLGVGGTWVLRDEGLPWFHASTLVWLLLALVVSAVAVSA